LKPRRIMGLLAILLGVIFLVFPIFISSQHLKVYVQVTSTTVRVLECEIEELLPLAMVDPYVRNLTQGDRTLRIEAYSANGTVLQEGIPGVGEGFDLIRTKNLNRFLPWRSTTEVHVRLLDSKGLVSEQTVESSAPLSISIWAGGFLLVAGVLIALYGFPKTTQSLKKQHLAQKRSMRKQRSTPKRR